MLGNVKVNAFLNTIAKAEGTLKAEDPYRVCYGYKHTIKDLSTHPAISGEWKGEILPDKYCKRVGLRPGCRSTAAGKYQITKGTFLYYSEKLGITTFYPDDQDLMAIGILKDIGAYEPILNDNISRAIRKASIKWASFPDSTAGQPKRSLNELIAYYNATKDNEVV